MLEDEEDLQERKNSSFPLQSNHCHSPPPKAVDQSSCAYNLRNFERGSVSLSLSLCVSPPNPPRPTRQADSSQLGRWRGFARTKKQFLSPALKPLPLISSPQNCVSELVCISLKKLRKRQCESLSFSVSLLQTLPDPQGRLTALNLQGAWGIIDSGNEWPQTWELSYGNLDLSVCTMLGMDHHATYYYIW